MKSNQIELQLKASFKIVSEMPWEDPHFYSQYLAQTYFYVSNSVSLLATCAGLLGPQHEKFKKRLIDHIHEEYGHEKLAVADLRGLGLDISQFTEFPETSAFYESQAFKMSHYSPITLWGWILALEGLAVQAGNQFYKRVQKAHGEKAAVFLKVHVTEDEEHFRVAMETIKDLPPEVSAQLNRNLLQSCQMFIRMLERCAEKSASSVQRASA